MEIHQLRYFIAVAEEANFSRAAERLRVAQPSLSQQIRKLEDECGQPLFERMPRRVALTEAGKRLLPYARQVLADLANARAALQEGQGEIAGHVTLGVIPTIAPFFLPDFIAKARTKFPAVEIRVVENVTDQLVRALDDSELDLALISTCRPANSFSLQRLGVEPLLLLVPADHPLAGSKGVSSRQLDREKMLVLHEAHCLSGEVSRFCRRQGVRPRVSLQGAQLETIARLVASGLGVSFFPRMSIGAAEQAGCAAVPFRGSPPTREINIISNPQRVQTNAAAALKELIISHFQAINRG